MEQVDKKEKIQTLLEKGVANILPSKGFVETALLSNKKLRVYVGFDPTAPSLHIGHTIQLRKLRHFQDLGHEIIFLIGDFTARIGDPTDKTAARKQLTEKEVKTNLKVYKKQAAKFISFSGANAAKVKFNNKWLGEMKFANVLQLASMMTVGQMLERLMFQKRTKWMFKCKECGELIIFPYNPESFVKGNIPTVTCPKCLHENTIDKDLQIFPPTKEPIYFHEFLYPLMQGYDSVYMDVDGEIGGDDQLFNMLVGRNFIKELKNKEKFVITTKLLEDSTGAKMGKTTGNMIALSDMPADIYGKVMSWTDGMIVPGFELCTDYTITQVQGIAEELQKGINPRDIKMRLAFEIVKSCTDDKEGIKAEQAFVATFQKKETTESIAEVVGNNETLETILIREGIAASKGEVRRLAEAGAISNFDTKIVLTHDDVKTVAQPGAYKIGKNRFIKII